MNNAWHIDGVITGIETIAEGHGIRELKRLREQYPSGKNWSKNKGLRHSEFPPQWQEF